MIEICTCACIENVHTHEHELCKRSIIVLLSNKHQSKTSLKLFSFVSSVLVQERKASKASWYIAQNVTTTVSQVLVVKMASLCTLSSGI